MSVSPFTGISGNVSISFCQHRQNDATMQNHFREVTKMSKQEGHPDEPECPSNEKIKTEIIITQRTRNMKWKRERRNTS